MGCVFQKAAYDGVKNTSSNFKYSFINKCSPIPTGASGREKLYLHVQGILIIDKDQLGFPYVWEEYLWRFLTGGIGQMGSEIIGKRWKSRTHITTTTTKTHSSHTKQLSKSQSMPHALWAESGALNSLPQSTEPALDGWSVPELVRTAPHQCQD